MQEFCRTINLAPPDLVLREALASPSATKQTQKLDSHPSSSHLLGFLRTLLHLLLCVFRGTFNISPHLAESCARRTRLFRVVHQDSTALSGSNAEEAEVHGGQPTIKTVSVDCSGR